MWGHPDQAEGPLAFAEKREPNWAEPAPIDRERPPARRPREPRRPAARRRAVARRRPGARRRARPGPSARSRAVAADSRRRCGAPASRPAPPVASCCPNGVDVDRRAVRRVAGRRRSTCRSTRGSPTARSTTSRSVEPSHRHHATAPTGRVRSSSRTDDASSPATASAHRSPPRPRRRPRPVHLRHHRAAQAGPAAPLAACSRCSTASSPAPAGARPAAPRSAPPRRSPDAEPHPGVAVAVGRDLPGALRPPGRRRGGRPGRLRPAGLRRPRSPRFGIRSTVLPPAAMTMLADDDADRRRSRPLRYVRSITAPLSPLQARRFQRPLRHRRAQQLRPDRDRRRDRRLERGRLAGARRRQARRGRPAARRRRLRPSARTAPTSAGELGELWVLTPALSAGYADGGDLADRLSADGWFRTGDVGRVDAEGFVWIEGRVSAMINRGGLKVLPGRGRGGAAPRTRRSPTSPSSGSPDDRLGEVPWAFVVADAAAPPLRPPRPRRALPRAPRAVQGAGPVRARSTPCPATRSARS